MKITLLNDKIPCFGWCANCYVISQGSHAFVVDPSISYKAILEQLKLSGLMLDGIILTHGHFDHILSVDALRRESGCKVFIHQNDADIMPYAEKNAFLRMFSNQDCEFPHADMTLKDGDILPLGDEKLTVIHTPGHTAGSVCFLGDGFIVTGDTLFKSSYGRCDLYSSNEADMVDSLQRLRGYDQKLVIYPGHGATELLGNALDNVMYYI